MPQPVSVTVNSSRCMPGAGLGSGETSTTTEPDSVNFRALPDEVAQHLLQARAIARQLRRHTRRHLQAQSEARLIEGRAEELLRRLQGLLQVEGLLGDMQLPGLDARDVQDVGQKPGEPVAGHDGVVREQLLLRVQGGVLEQADHADNAV